MVRPSVFLSCDKGKSANYRRAFSAVGFSIARNPENADALCLGGGGDVCPCIYGELNYSSFNIDIRRDEEELYLLRKFLDKGKPVMAICRGLQIANVYLGGTLVQNVLGHSQIGGEDVFHKVAFFGELQTLYGESGFVNSAHHQCVGKLGRGAIVTAMGDNGVIEGFSRERLHAYQFHPERLCLNSTDGRKIFSAFYGKYFA